MKDDEASPGRGGPDTSGELVRFMVERELDALATIRPNADGLRLRVLMRMADRAPLTG